MNVLADVIDLFDGTYSNHGDHEVHIMGVPWTVDQQEFMLQVFEFIQETYRPSK